MSIGNMRPPSKGIPPNEYGVLIPFQFKDGTHEIISHHEINISKAIIGVNISYEFFDVQYKDDIKYSRNITTTIEIWIIDYLDSNEIEKIDVKAIVVKGISTRYENINYFISSVPTYEYLDRKKIILNCSKEYLNIDFPSYLSIFINNSGWKTNIFDRELGIKSIIINEDEIMIKENEYNDMYAHFEENKAQTYRNFGIFFSGLILIEFIFRFIDNYIEYKYEWE